MAYRGLSTVLLAASMALAAGGCSGSPATPTSPAAPTALNGAASGSGGGAAGSLDAATLDAMNAGIQDEFHAEFTYLKVIDTFGEVQPFASIVFAEERHSEAIARLFVNRGLTVPGSRWSLENVPEFSSIAEACAGGVAAELENIALYDALLTRELPQDVRNVFTNIRAASLENHLPAFEACCACSR